MSAAQIGREDPNVKIPAAIKAQAKLAEDAFKAVYQPGQVAEGEAPPADTPAPGPGDAPAPSNAAPLEPPTPPADDATWEHKYNSMKGRVDSLTKKYDRDLGRLNDHVANLENIIATIQASPQASAADTRTEKLITEKEEQEYGAELLDVVSRRARETLSPEVKALQRQVDALQNQLGRTSEATAQSARNRMHADLDSAVPNWREINQSPEFLRWLELPDVMSGDKRITLLKRAYTQNRSPGVLAFFEGFLSEEAALDPAQRAEPDLTTEDATSGKVPLEAFAAPGRAKTAAPSSSPAEKPIITGAQIAKFYADVANGVYRGKDAEKDRLEAMIFDAQREGRLR